MDGREVEGILERWWLEQVSCHFSALVLIQQPTVGIVFWEKWSAFWVKEKPGTEEKTMWQKVELLQVD